MSSLFQRAAVQVNDYRSAPPGWFGVLHTAGYRTVHVGLRPPDDAAVPAWWVAALANAGWRVLGSFSPEDGSTPWSPEHAFVFCVEAQLALPRLTGFVVNAEDAWEGADLAGGGLYSADFLRHYRERWPRRSLALNTYSGCGGINLAAWEAAGARLYVQSHREGQPYAEPVTAGVQWAAQYGWHNLRRVKPCLGIYKGTDGLRPSAELLAGSCMEAGTRGLVLYYIEGCWDEPSLPAGIAAHFGPPGGIAYR